MQHNEAPASAPSAPYTEAPAGAPVGSAPDWASVTKTLGYPRPQGQLSNFNWGLTPEARAYYENLYNQVRPFK